MIRIDKETYLKILKSHPARVKRTKNCFFLLEKNKWIDYKKKGGEKK